MLGTIKILLSGIPFLYQGQEIGMRNCRMKSVEEFDDINTKDQYRLALRMGFNEKEALEACNRLSRDNARTPMQWSDEEHAGFTTGTPWLKVNPNYREINVQAQEKEKDSVLNYYRKLTALLKSPDYKETFVYGHFIPAYEETESVIAYYRQDERNCILVLGNWGREAEELRLSQTVQKVLLNNLQEYLSEGQKLTLLSGQALVLLLQG